MGAELTVGYAGSVVAWRVRQGEEQLKGKRFTVPPGKLAVDACNGMWW